MKHYFILFTLLFVINFCNANDFVENKYYAGIEVGSRGVRWAVLEILNGQKSADSYKIVKDSSIITNYINFNEKSNKETLEAIKYFYNISLGKYNLLKSNILVGISSGVDLAAIKEGKSAELDALRNRFMIDMKNNSINWQVLGSVDESENVFISLIPNLAKKETLLFDFGSGNVKGGFFNENAFNEIDFVPLYVNWGSSSILKAIQKGAPQNLNITYFYSKLDSIISKVSKTEIQDMFLSRAGFTEKANIVFGGGISWAVNNFLMPDQSKFEFLKVNLNDLNKLRQLLKANFKEEKLNPDIFTTKILDAETKLIATNKINTVLKVYDTKALICGVEFLNAFIATLKAFQPNLNVNVTQLGSSGWLPGFIQQNIPVKF